MKGSMSGRQLSARPATQGASEGLVGAWRAQRISTRAAATCAHVPNVAALHSREGRTRVEVCDRCRAWRLAPLPPPRAPLVAFAYAGPFCLLPPDLIGQRAR